MSPDAIWGVVRDSAMIPEWFDALKSVETLGDTRVLTLEDGSTVEEEIVLCDDIARRFQYRIIGGDIPVESHLATIDVLPTEKGAMIIYSTEVSPAEVAKVIEPAIKAAVNNLVHLTEGH